jgi:hypothetical protein
VCAPPGNLPHRLEFEQLLFLINLGVVDGFALIVLTLTGYLHRIPSLDTAS